ncbi:DoxX family protein [Neolewinella aurantiaca]|uniref:DoxX family protein n=1 Tax=Neolewinella aurantiaca TaxID=2602767 RepID=A0A5C7FEJ1_9BACT|nr:DoxX family protein [Neolewinella aurantiaca]TXF89542.1 DoxX family protein [Neolewinella aurantiaca]
MKSDKIIYWVATGLTCLIFTFSAGMYILNYEMISGFFPELGFPTWLVAPLAAAKLLGVAAILTRKVRVLTEWAYAGFFFDAVLAQAAHVDHGDGWLQLSLLAIIVTLVSRIYYGKVFGA